MKSDQDKLGAILYMHGNKYICEGGICDKKKSILWEDVEALFVSAIKEYAIVIPKYESIDITVRSTRGYAISVKLGSIGWIGGEKKKHLSDIYGFIVSKVIDRQSQKLIGDIGEGKRVSFHSFDITSNAMYRKKFFGGYDTIDMYRIVGCDFDSGEFVIEFVDDNGRLKRKKCGYVYEIPNVHLAQAFLLSIARHNLEAMNIPT